MEYNFKIDDNDSKIIKKCKIEANLIIESLKQSNSAEEEIKEEYNNLSAVIKVVGILNDDKDNIDINKINNYVVKFNKYGILAPLKLIDEEFVHNEELDLTINARCHAIIKNKEGKLLYYKAYDFDVVRLYDGINKVELPINKINQDKIKTSSKNIYLTSGGVLTGDYIKFCYLRNNVLENHNYNPKDALHLNVSAIETENGYIFTIDKRDPKLKSLMNFYEVPVNKKPEYKSIDIRKYRKIKQPKVKVNII